MIRIAILSGKGGTGKTSVAASFGYLAGKRAVLCDCDVDASNLALVAGAQNIQSREYSGGMVAVIDPEACIGCGACARVCRFDAIEKSGSEISNRSSFVRRMRLLPTRMCFQCNFHGRAQKRRHFHWPKQI